MDVRYGIVFDLETSGLDKEKCEISQIAAVVVNLETLSLEDVDTFEVKIEVKETPEALEVLKLSSYNTIEWEIEAVSSFYQANDMLRKFLSPYTYSFISRKGYEIKTCFAIGHNIERFDLPFYRSWCDRKQKWLCPFGFKNIDTLQLSLIYETLGFTNFDGKHTLFEIATSLGISYDETKLHDAEYDVGLTSCIFIKMMKDMKKEGIALYEGNTI